MKRPHGPDDHDVGDEIVAWSTYMEDLDRGPGLRECIALTVNIVSGNAPPCRWNTATVAERFDVPRARVSERVPSDRYAREWFLTKRSVLTSKSVRELGWCVELWREK